MFLFYCIISLKNFSHWSGYNNLIFFITFYISQSWSLQILLYSLSWTPMKPVLDLFTSPLTLIYSPLVLSIKLPHTSGHGWRLRGATPWQVRGSGPEELPHTQGQGWQLRGATPRPSSSGCTGAGGPRGATPRLRSGGAAVRIYPSSKVRSSSCTLLEQPWRHTPCPS